MKVEGLGMTASSFRVARVGQGEDHRFRLGNSAFDKQTGIQNR